MYPLVTLLVWARMLMASSLSVSPPHFEIEKPGGETVADIIKIFNPSDTPMAVRFYAGDFWYDKAGKRSFPSGNSTPYSAAPWVSFAKEELEVPAKSSIEASFVLAIPPHPRPSAYATLFVERVARSLASTPTKTHGNLAISIRLAVPVLYKRPDASIQKITLEKFKMKKPTSFEPLTVRFSLMNRDEVFTFPEGTILVVNEKTKGAVAKTEIRRERVVLPGQELPYELALSFDPKKGKYQGLLSLFFGPHKNMTKAFEFSIP